MCFVSATSGDCEIPTQDRPHNKQERQSRHKTKTSSRGTLSSSATPQQLYAAVREFTSRVLIKRWAASQAREF